MEDFFIDEDDDWINELETGYKGVKYDKLVPLLIEAIKELREENINLRSDIEDLKSINS